MLRLTGPLHLGQPEPADARGSVDALAWTLLLTATGSRTVADDWYVDLADELIARPPDDRLSISPAELLDWLGDVPNSPTAACMETACASPCSSVLRPSSGASPTC
jgi:hypothetical protein